MWEGDRRGDVGGGDTLSSLCAHQRAPAPVWRTRVHRGAGAHPEHPEWGAKTQLPFGKPHPRPGGDPRGFWNAEVLDLAGPGVGGGEVGRGVQASPRGRRARSPPRAFPGLPRPGRVEGPRSAPSGLAPPNPWPGPRPHPAAGWLRRRDPAAGRSRRRVTAPESPPPAPPPGPAPGRFLLMARRTGAAGSRAAQRSGRAEPACRGPEPPTTGPPPQAASSGGGCSTRRRPPAPG